MKTIIGIASLFAVIASTHGLECLECFNATSIDNCNTFGTVKTCGHPSDPNKVFSCQTHWRQRFDVPSLWISRVCKEADACQNNANNNPTDCTGDENQRVCRCCCYQDRCSQTINEVNRCSGVTIIERDPVTTPPPPPVCDEPQAPENGDYICEDIHPEYGYINGTVCDYVCNEDFTLVGPNKTVCGPNQNPEVDNVIAFAPPPPKCVPSECFSPTNLVIAIDSSCSVGPENWDQIISFLRQLISHLEVAPHHVNVAAFRYNIRVDKESAVLFGSEASTDRELLELALEEFPYDGEGTNTGLALRYAQELFEEVELVSAKKVLLLITDGKADDSMRFSEEVLQLTLSDIIPFAVGLRIKEDLDPIDLASLTGFIQDHFYYLYGGVEELTPTIARILAARICVAEKYEEEWF